jgi:PAS domain S-box-containing protein
MLAEVHSTPILRNGRVSEILLVARDITERKLAEEALRESEEKYRALFNQSIAGIHLHDLEGRMLDVNEMACVQVGYSREELLELTVFDIHSDEEGTINLSKDEILRLWRVWELGDRFTIEAGHRHKDGTVIPVQVSTGVIRYGDKEHILAIVQDISERKQVEQALRASEERYRALFQNIQAGVVVHKADSQVVMCNSQAEEVLGLTEDQMWGKKSGDPAWRFLREDGTPMPRDEYPVSQVLNTGQPLRNLVIGIVRPREDDVVWVMANADPTFDAAGNIDEVIVSFMDIKERKRAKEKLTEYANRLEEMVEEKVRQLEQERAKAIQLDKLAALGEMATGIAHELRQPLTAIGFEADYLALLGNRAQDEHQGDLNALLDPAAAREIGDGLKEDLARCRRLIDHLRDFGRVSGEPPVPICLNDPIEDSFILVGARLHNHGVDVRLDLADDLPPIVAHPNRLEQVFLNLVSNAG